MKVEKVVQSNPNVQKTRQRNVNMTSFGNNSASIEQQETSFNNKKSEEALKSSFLSNVSFSGIKDEVIVTVDRKYGPTKVYERYGTSGRLIKTLSPGESDYSYRDTDNYYIEKPIIDAVYHARMERGGSRASGSSAAYVAKDAITESPYYYNGSTIRERYPVRDGYGEQRKSVYYSDPGERMDETTPYADYVVYAPGAYYKKRTFLEKLLD